MEPTEAMVPISLILLHLLFPICGFKFIIPLYSVLGSCIKSQPSFIFFLSIIKGFPRKKKCSKGAVLVHKEKCKSWYVCHWKHRPTLEPELLVCLLPWRCAFSEPLNLWFLNQH